MSASLAELCSDAKTSPRTILWSPRFGSTEDSLRYIAPLGEVNSGTLLMEGIDSIDRYDSRRDHLVAILRKLHAGTLVDNFGEEVMAWTILHDSSWKEGDFGTEIDKKGYNCDFLAWSSLLAWHRRKSQPPQPKELLTQHAVMQAVHGEPLTAIDLQELLAESALAEVHLSQDRLRDYSLLPLSIRPEASNEIQGQVRVWPGKEGLEQAYKDPDRQNLHLRYDIWLDTPVGFALAYKGIPQARVGLIANNSNELIIQQLQRIQGRLFDPGKAKEDPKTGERTVPIEGYRLPRGLVTLDWAKLLIRSTAYLAAQLDMESVALQTSSGILSRTYHGRPSCHLTRDQAIKAYDETAYRLGFLRDSDNIWHASTQAMVQDALTQRPYDQILRRPASTKLLPVEPWVRADYSSEATSRDITTIDKAFACLGDEGPVARSIAAACANGRVAILDAGCGRGTAIAGLKERVLAETSLHKNSVQIVGIDGKSYVMGLDRGEFDRLVENDIDLRVDHLGHAVLEPSYYDVAYAYDTIGHNEDPSAMINNLLSSLKPGGVLYCDILRSQHVTIRPLIEELGTTGWHIVLANAADDPAGKILLKFGKPAN